MSNRVRSSLHSLVIIAVLFFSVIGTTIVYADGGTTGDTPPTETTTECASDGTTNECSSEAATVEAPAAPAVQESSSAGNDSNAAPAEQAALNDVPANTAVAVVNAEGQAEPLATQAAADALATTSDPIWCPAAQTTPTPGANGCTASFSSFNSLLAFLAANPTFQGPGTIYVQQGAYSGGESSINFNNYSLANISGANLTIQGAWDTSNNTVNLAGASTFNNTSFVIGSATNPWGGNLTINNLTLNFNPNGQSGTGITVYSAGDINLTQVNVTNSATGAGAELNAGGNVTIKSSKFDRNKTAGAIIRAKKSVAISDSSFSNPVNGRRQITGLDIVSDGSVSLFNVLANTNREAGATINAGGRVTLVQSSFSDTKSMRGSAFFGYGLQVVTPDAIDLDTVTANSNFLWGASLNAGGDVAIINSIFNANTTESPGFIDDTGLLVTSGGNVAISSSHADDNRLIGATITAKGRVDITDSTFSNNKGVTLDSAGNQTFHGYGLQVVTTCKPDPNDPNLCIPGTIGSITLTRVVASNNTLFGAHLESKGDVTISGSDFSGQTTGVATTQLGRGLEVISGGTVILDSSTMGTTTIPTTINNNQTFGANIQAADGVFLDTVTATGNGTNGVELKTNCSTLFLIDGTYTGNGQYGLSLTDTQLNQMGSPVLTPNGAGDIFQNPTTCVFPTTVPSEPPAPPVDGTVPTQTDTTVTESVSRVLSSPLSLRILSHLAATGTFVGNSSGAGNVTLSSFLANTTLARGTGVGLFVGNYAYIDSLSGMQIFVYYPAYVAMLGPQ